MVNWKTRPLDIDFFIDSGLLFEINWSILHPIGLALTAQVKNGKKEWAIKDSRNNPENLVFDKASAKAGRKKIRKFVEEFTSKQSQIRDKKLGWTTQPVYHLDGELDKND